MPDREPTAGIPGWIKVTAIIFIVVVMLVAIIALVGGGDHGPQLHSPGSDDEGSTPLFEEASELAKTAGGPAFAPDRIHDPVGEPVDAALGSADVMHELVVDDAGFHMDVDRERNGSHM